MSDQTQATEATKHRAGPYERIFAAIDSFVADAEKTGGEHVDVILATAKVIRSRIEGLRTVSVALPPPAPGEVRRGRPKGSKNRTPEEIEASKSVAGRWYVGESEEGLRTAFQSNRLPSRETHPEYAHVFGPIGTKNGAEYRAARTTAQLAEANVTVPTVF